jgi:hypothetical protein
LAGCNSGNPELTRMPDIPTWDGLTALNQEDIMKPLVMGAQMGSDDSVKTHAASPKFQEAFAKFEKEPIPSKYSTPEREAARNEVIKNLKAVIDGANSGASAADLKAAVEAADKALRTLSTPDQTAAAKK